MNSQPDQLTPEESLALITTMIREAKGKWQKNAFYFLLWGWVVVLAYLGMFALIYFEYTYFYAVWLITIPAWIVTIIRSFTRKTGDTSSLPRTHIQTITLWLWLAYGVIIATLVIFGSKINFQLTASILLISALPTMVSGVILKFRPLILGGALLWISGIICFLVPWQTQPLIGAVGIICGYLIPGYMLKKVQAAR
jgi:hypothetical protein